MSLGSNRPHKQKELFLKKTQAKHARDVFVYVWVARTRPLCFIQGSLIKLSLSLFIAVGRNNSGHCTPDPLPTAGAGPLLVVLALVLHCGKSCYQSRRSPSSYVTSHRPHVARNNAPDWAKQVCHPGTTAGKIVTRKVEGREGEEKAILESPGILRGDQNPFPASDQSHEYSVGNVATWGTQWGSTQLGTCHPYSKQDWNWLDLNILAHG